MNQQGDLFSSTRAEQIFRRFAEFHQANPHIWKLFERFAIELANAGRARYSVAAIIERIRWHVNVETASDDVKINNDFRAYYSRMFMAKHPELGKLFQVRKRRSTDEPAFEQDIATFNTGPAGDESALLARLRLM